MNLLQGEPPIGKSADGGSPAFGAQIKGQKAVLAHSHIGSVFSWSTERNSVAKLIHNVDNSHHGKDYVAPVDLGGILVSWPALAAVPWQDLNMLCHKDERKKQHPPKTQMTVVECSKPLDT
jgi:hypothetical protein